MTTVENVIATMESKFNAEAAEDLDIVFQFNIEDGDLYYVSICDQKCQIKKGEHDAPNVTLIMDSETMVGVMTGELDGMAAFMEGKIRAEGEMMLATKLNELFPV